MAADSQRFFGPVLSSAEHESVFAGSDEKERMALVRKQIFKIRSKWTVTEEYDKLRETVRKYVRPEIQPKNLRIQMNRLLQGYHDYADTDYERPSRTAPEDYSALELYCSKEGYEYVFSLISQTLRIKEVSPEILVTAVTLVEYLTIDLYNLRLSNLGDLRYANYQGIIHRGLCVTSKALEDYREVANRKDIVKRNFSIPLAFMSSTTDLKVMERFSQQTEAADLHRMHWTIHVHGVDPDLLNAYLKAYPDSIVTSICAMPVARLSPFGEKEVLLRGAFFQIINMQSDEVKGYTVHKLEVAMMNANRDHVTELGSNEGVKELQREFFHQIVAASKYEVCAALAARYSMSDAEAYRSLQQEKLDRIRELSGVDVVRNTGLASARSGEVAVWLGGSLFSSYSRHYANLRRSWQEAVTSGTWSDGEKVLSREYEWRRGEWFNIGKLSEPGKTAIREGYTPLHEMARRDLSIPDGDRDNLLARDRINKVETLRTFDGDAKTAREIAIENHNELLTPLLEPTVLHPVPPEKLARLQLKLHTLMHEVAGEYMRKHDFRMPQLSVLTEMENPELWVPIPHMYGVSKPQI